MPSKEDLLNDINIIVLASSKQDMSLPSNAKKFSNYFEQKKSFKTNVGQQYLERLNLISELSHPETCFICKKNEAYDCVLCESCMQKYSRGQKSFYKKADDFTALDNLFNEPNEKGIKSKVTHTGNNIGSNAAIDGRTYKDNKEEKKKNSKTSGLAVAALIFTVFIITCPVGFILAIMDLSIKDGRKHGVSTCAFAISAFFLVGFIAAYFEDKTETQNTNTIASTGQDHQSDNTEDVTGIDHNAYIPCTTTEVKELIKSDYALALTTYKDSYMAVTGKNQALFDYYPDDATTINLDNGCFCKFTSEEQRDRLIKSIPPGAYLTVYGYCYELSSPGIGCWFVAIDDIEILD